MLEKQEFTQLIHEATHIEGNIIDQVYIRDKKKYHNYSAEVHAKYFTDHRAIQLTVINTEKSKPENNILD